MSRSGYSDDYDGDNWDLIRWRGAVASAMRGRKGQAFLRELLAALDAMPQRELIGNSFQASGGVCTLGAVCQQRGVVIPALADPDDWGPDEARAFARQSLQIPDALAAEIMFFNDDGEFRETPAARWARMRAWIAERIVAQDGGA